MKSERLIEVISDILSSKGLTWESSLKELNSTYNIALELEGELDERVSNSPDKLTAHISYLRDLVDILSGYDRPTSIESISHGIQTNIKAGKLIQIKYYGDILSTDILLDDTESKDPEKQLELNLKSLARFYCITTYIPELRNKIKTLSEIISTEINGDEIQQGLPLKTVGLNLMFMKELGMLHHLIHQKPGHVAKILSTLIPVFKGQSKTIERLLTTIRSNNKNEKNHPYHKKENEEKVRDTIKRYLPGYKL